MNTPQTFLMASQNDIHVAIWKFPAHPDEGAPHPAPIHQI